jgi:hypothetical protein
MPVQEIDGMAAVARNIEFLAKIPDSIIFWICCCRNKEVAINLRGGNALNHSQKQGTSF